MRLFLFFLIRLEYEQNRDMESRILELESSISALKTDLVQIKVGEDKAKSTAEEANAEIIRYKGEVKGMVLLPHVTIGIRW